MSRFGKKNIVYKEKGEIWREERSEVMGYSKLMMVVVVIIWLRGGEMSILSERRGVVMHLGAKDVSNLEVNQNCFANTNFKTHLLNFLFYPRIELIIV